MVLICKFFHLMNVLQHRSMSGLASKTKQANFATALLASCTFLVCSVSDANESSSSPNRSQTGRLTTYQNEAAWRDFNIEIVENYVIPNYKILANKNNNLHITTQAFCEVLTTSNPVQLQESLAATKQAFHQSMDAWQLIQNINFGPVEIDMRYHSIQFWPDKRNHIGKQLNKLISTKNETVLTVDNFDKNSVSVKGFPAIERLLFNESALNKFKKNPYSCQVLQGISRYLVATANSLHDEWVATMLPQFKDVKQLGGYFEDEIDAATALLKSLVEPIEVIRDLKLDRPLGSQFDNVKFKRLESWRSKRSLTNLQLNIQSLENMFLGNTSKASGLRAFLTENESTQILENFQDVKNEMSKIAEPLEVAILTDSGYQTAKKISIALTNLHTSLEDAIKQSGIRLGFNSRDGD
jgi:predicted lipoprotein